MNAQLALDFTAPVPRFYNTTRLAAEQLTVAIAAAKHQDDAVLLLYRAFRKLGPSRAWQHYIERTGKHNTPITSIRRSVTNLTKARALRKTKDRVDGAYGKPEFEWEIAP
jgi:hypothetical protein